jgi:hypothetical protein
LALGTAFFDRELMRLDLGPAAPSKVASRAWNVTIVASMAGVPRRCLYVFEGFGVFLRDREIDKA